MTRARNILLIVAALQFVSGAEAQSATPMKAPYYRCISKGVPQCTDSANCNNNGAMIPQISFKSYSECTAYKAYYLCASPKPNPPPLYTLACLSDVTNPRGCPAGFYQVGFYSVGALYATESDAYTACSSTTPKLYQWCYDYTQSDSAGFGTCVQVSSTVASPCPSPKKIIGGFSSDPTCFDIPMSQYSNFINKCSEKCRPAAVGCASGETYQNTYSGPEALPRCEAGPSGYQYRLCADPDSGASGDSAGCERADRPSCFWDDDISLEGSLGLSIYQSCGDLYRKLNSMPHITCTRSGYTRCRMYVESDIANKGCHPPETVGTVIYPNATACHSTLSIVCSGGYPDVADGNCFCSSNSLPGSSLCFNGQRGVYVANRPMGRTCADYCPASSNTSEALVKCIVSCKHDGLSSTSSEVQMYGCIPYNNCKNWKELVHHNCELLISSVKYFDMGMCLKKL